MMPPVSTPVSTACRIEPALRIVLSARMWCSWPCSTPRPWARSTPSDVPNSADSMSWVASALPAKSTSTKPASTSATIAGAAPVCTTPGPPTHSTFLPAAFASRMPSATWRTSTACGFSLETSDSMKPNEPSALVSTGHVDPDAGGAADDLHAGLHVGHRQRVHAQVASPAPSTISPQSISGFSTGTQWPSRRTRVARLVVE